jgi:type IV pilus assembly protein PilC
MVSTKDIVKRKTPSAPSRKGRLNELFNKDIQLFGKGMSDKHKEAFFTELHILISSGIDIRTSLDLIAAEQKKEKDKGFYTRMKTLVVNGKSLSIAIEMMQVFSPYEMNSIKIGEETGRLDSGSIHLL